MAFNIPKNCDFAVDGDGRKVTLTPVEGGDAVEVQVDFGQLVIKEGEEDAGKVRGVRYRVSADVIVMGNSVSLEEGGVSFDKAVASFVENALRVDADAYDVEYDEDDEFFSQKAPTVKAPSKDDVWANKDYDQEALNKLRGDAEAALAVAQDSEKGSQDDARAVSYVLMDAFEAVGGSRKALQNWAQGGKGGENMALLSKLGKGVNALTEAMRLGQLTDAEYAVIPASLTSGKGVDNHGRVSIKQIVENANMPKIHKEVDTSGDTPDIDGVVAMLKQIAASGFGIDTSAVEFSDLPNEVDEKAGAFVAEFLANHGKAVSTYNKGEYTQAKLAYGAVRVSTAGRSLFKRAVDAVAKYDELVADDDGAVAGEVLAGMFIKTGGNALLKEAYAVLKAHNESVAAGNAASAAKAQADQLGDDVKPATWAELDPVVAAQYLNTRIAKHSNPYAVAVALRGLLADHTAPTPAAAQAAE
jgi:hypothetical protein